QPRTARRALLTLTPSSGGTERQDAPDALSWAIAAVSKTTLGRPRRLAFGLALRSPARTRPASTLRSSSATAPNTVKTIFPGVKLPKPHRAQRFFFSIEETQHILRAASEPYRTFYWLAAETGMRAGELCGLRVDDLDLERGLVHVRQSVWRGKLQEPKTETAVRTFEIGRAACREKGDSAGCCCDVK